MGAYNERYRSKTPRFASDRAEMTLRASIGSKMDAKHTEGEIGVMRRERILPDEKTLVKISRYEAHLSRQLYQALGAIPLSDIQIVPYLSVFCLLIYNNCLYNLRMKYGVCTTPDMEVNVERLRTLRTEHVLTLRELAEAAGVSKDTIWRLENGHSEAHPSTIRKLAKTLGVQPKELVKTGGDNAS